jgi:nucleoside-diphosphate-sugar epimerase
MEHHDYIVGRDDLILVTGATGFIGSRLVQALVNRGFRSLRCFARPSGDAASLVGLSRAHREVRIEVFTGNLLSSDDCAAAAKDAAIIFHLATGRDGKSFPDAFMNSVITTRNLLDVALRHKCLRRFVNISSFAVYTNKNKPGGMTLDETCPIEAQPQLRGAYCFAKVKQDELVIDYGKRFGLPYVIVRPGYVYGPGKGDISSRVGIGTFGVFLHLGGSNTIPLTYVDNCAAAIALAGLQKGIDDGEVFNIVDDNLPSSRGFLRQYKKNVRRFRSLYLPHAVSYALCYLWEQYSTWSEGQLPPTFNRRHWYANWKKTRYSNDRLKTRTGWTPEVTMAEGFQRFFEACRNGQADA